jgi:tetratricopeptide (TPR) repeat protein
MGIIRKTLSLSLLVLLFCQFAFAQPTTRRANKEFELHAYNLAIKSYLRVLERKPNDVEALTNLADSYYHLNRLDEARIYYERAVNTGDVDADVYFRYGQTLKGIGLYGVARTQFRMYAQSFPIEGNHYAESCDFAQTRLNDPPTFEVRNEYLNSSASDFGPAIYLDKVVYNSARIDLKRSGEASSSSNWTGSANNRLLITSRDQNGFLKTPSFLRSELSNSSNEGPIAYAPDGKWVAITRNNFVDGTRHIPSSGMEMSLYIAEVSANGDWVNAIPFPHNGSDYSNGYPCFSPDGQALYFASNREDSYGGYDLYVSFRVGNTWSYPENLGGLVNTSGNEITPFYDGNSLYFASDWHPGFGGYDIFKSDRLGTRWGNPTHTGSGVNSPRDDYGFVYDFINNIGYFVSNRVGGKGLEDIYRVQRSSDNLVIQVLNASDRQPLKNAIIDFSSCGKGRFMTDGEGMFVFEASDGLNCTATVTKEGYSSSSVNITTIGNSQNRSFEVLLRKSGEEYYGRVVNVTNGYALEGVSVKAVNQANGNVLEALTDFRGEYSLAMSPQNSYLIKYSKPGFVDVSRPVRTLNGMDKSILGNISIMPTSTMAQQGGLKKANVVDPTSYSAEDDIIVTEGYSVQVAAYTASKPFDLSRYRNKLSSISNVYTHLEDNKKKVRVGPFPTKDDAKSALREVKAKGYSSAFVVRQNAVDPSANSEFTPRGVPEEYGFDGGNVFANNRKEAAPQNTSAENYLVKLASYRDTKWFQASKVSDLGEVKELQKGSFTVMLLSGYTSKDDAQKALNSARERGFTGAYMVKEGNQGELIRVN